MTAKYKCEECKDTREILIESLQISRPYYSKEKNGMVYDVAGLGNWQKTQCYCVGEIE